VGRRPVLMIGLAGSAIFYFAFGLATVMESWWGLFLSRVGAGISGATISTAHAYIADSTSLEQRPRGMALIGMAFGLGFTFGPLLGFLAAPARDAVPGPWPGYAAAGFSAVAFLLAAVLLPESKHETSQSAVAWLVPWGSFGSLIGIPSVLIVLVTIFVCVFSFANFETTLSLLIKGRAFTFSWGEVCLTYAFIGLTLAMVQGGVVRRLAGRVSEGVLAGGGAAAEVVGFLLLAVAVVQNSVALLFAALIIVVSGFSFMQPNLNSLLSRRSPPDRQGVILGIGQSVSSLARIAGSALGIPLLKIELIVPYAAAAVLMGCGALLVMAAARRGRDYGS
jgi:MFS family permease